MKAIVLIDEVGKINYKWILVFLLLCYFVLLLSFFLFLSKYFLIAASIFPFVIISVYIYLNRLELAVLIYVGLIPLLQHLNINSIPIGDFLIAPHMLIQFLLLIGIFNQFLFSYEPSLGIRLNKLDKFIILFFVLSIFPLFFGYSLPTDSAKRWLLFYSGIFETITFYFIIKYLLNKNVEIWSKLILAIVFTSFASLIAAILEFHKVGFSFINIYLTRMQNGFGYHNVNLFGLHSALVFPILFYAIVDKKFERYKILSWISLLILTMLSVLTFNRGTILVIVIQLFLLLFIKNARKIVFVLLAFGFSTVIYFHKLLLFYLFRFLSGPTGMKNPLLDESTLYRLALWEVGLKTMIKYPLGVGADAFQYFWIKSGIASDLFFGSPHQIFLSIGVGYGIPAVLIFIIILVLFYRYLNYIIKNRNKSSASETEIFRYIKISLIGYIVIGCTTGGELSHLSGFKLPNNGYTLILFILIAITSSFRYIHKVNKSND